MGREAGGVTNHRHLPCGSLWARFTSHFSIVPLVWKSAWHLDTVQAPECQSEEGKQHDGVQISYKTVVLTADNRFSKMDTAINT